MNELSHIGADGQPKMVNVAEKPITLRSATARATVVLPEAVFALLKDGELILPKGALRQTAIIAGVMGAKKTGELIPLCHPLGLEGCDIHIEFFPERRALEITCTTSLHGRTGVEMEALTGATIAALTVYDMCKAVSHEIVIQEVKLLKKNGGKRDIK